MEESAKEEFGLPQLPIGGFLMFALVVFEPSTSKILKQELHEDITDAAQAYRAAEQENLFGADLEVVLVGTTGVENLYTTHSHYFRQVVDAPWSWLLEGL